MRRSIVVDVVLAAALAALVLGAIAAAHDASTFYTKKWKAGERNQNYGFHDAVPGGDFRDRVEDGAQKWNPLAGNMQFQRGGVNVTWTFDSTNCHNPGDNSIHYGNIDGGPAAQEEGEFNTVATTTTCHYNSDVHDLYSFRIKFDEDDPWYTGTGDTPSGRYDLIAVAAHEFGHATGFGRGAAQDHFDRDSTYCKDSPKHTMCPTISRGYNNLRSLEEHDRHTFNNAYGG